MNTTKHVYPAAPSYIDKAAMLAVVESEFNPDKLFRYEDTGTIYYDSITKEDTIYGVSVDLIGIFKAVSLDDTSVKPSTGRQVYQNSNLEYQILTNRTDDYLVLTHNYIMISFYQTSPAATIQTATYLNAESSKRFATKTVTELTDSLHRELVKQAVS